jgi:hypothetical protein
MWQVKVLIVAVALATVTAVQPPKAGAGDPEVVEISEEKFACNCDVIKISTAKGRVEVKKDSDSELLPVRGRTIRWWCEAAYEDWQAPEGTQYIVVSRGPRGAGTVIYYKKK